MNRRERKFVEEIKEEYDGKLSRLANEMAEEVGWSLTAEINMEKAKLFQVYQGISLDLRDLLDLQSSARSTNR